MAQNTDDGRRFSRFDTLEYALLMSSGLDEPLPAIIVDISLGGLQLRTRVPLESGDEFLMQIGQGYENPITTAVEVRYCAKIPHTGLHSVGVRFLPGHSEQRMRLVHYIHDAFAKQGDKLLAS
ncbi:MAG: PilZ domain-containing protein [Chthonomonas sp.]|nr:PilZ domain-containing protein [Chthonomonas sp.]